MAPPERHIVVSCEHGSHRVPADYRALFRGQQALLRSHRGWDEGALPVARSLSRALDAELIAATTTRLLVDLNRSPHNPAVFSERTRELSRASRDALLRRYHVPHWNRVRAALEAGDPDTVHLAVHSFSPVWRGQERLFQAGILYDPTRSRERRFARHWQRRLAARLGPSQVRRNAPYRGSADGLTTAMRRELSPGRYLGLELELNQAAIADARRRRQLIPVLLASFRETLAIG